MGKEKPNDDKNSIQKGVEREIATTQDPKDDLHSTH